MNFFFIIFNLIHAIPIVTDQNPVVPHQTLVQVNADNQMAIPIGQQNPIQNLGGWPQFLSQGRMDVSPDSTSRKSIFSSDGILTASERGDTGSFDGFSDIIPINHKDPAVDFHQVASHEDWLHLFNLLSDESDSKNPLDQVDTREPSPVSSASFNRPPFEIQVPYPVQMRDSSISPFSSQSSSTHSHMFAINEHAFPARDLSGDSSISLYPHSSGSESRAMVSSDIESVASDVISKLSKFH